MGLSYILLLTAFYVDNGKSLPLWKYLPTIAYWLLPSAIGLPLIVTALLRHPLVRPSKRSATMLPDSSAAGKRRPPYSWMAEVQARATPLARCLHGPGRNGCKIHPWGDGASTMFSKT